MPSFSSIPAAVRLSLAGAMLLQVGSAAACSTTPAEALRAFEQGDPDKGANEVEGYRVAALHSDALLGRNWASVEHCGHPEWPRVSVPQVRLSGVPQGGSQQRDVHAVIHAGVQRVRAGETVRLWRQEANVRLEVSAVSEESGAVGDRIRLRLATKPQEGELPRTIVGLVRGPADVEME